MTRWSTDRPILPVVFVVAGTAIAIGALVVGELVVDAGVATLLRALVGLFPTLGFLLAIVVVWLWGTSREETGPEPFAPGLREDVESRSHREIAEETREQLATATTSQFSPELGVAERSVHDMLSESAARSIRTTVGLSEQEIQEAIRTGEWTDDPVAVAMLSPDIRQPLWSRLFALVAPGRAYRFRVERTVAAIERLESHRTRGTGTDAVASDEVTG